MSDEQNKAQEEQTVDEMLQAEDNQTAENDAPLEGEVVDAPEIGDTDIERIAELEAALETANATISGQKDAVLRAKADSENARRRADQEVEKARKFALERFAGELLPVLDNLERALQVSNPEDESVRPILEGVELTFKSFVSTVEKFGMEVVDPQGKPFNPEQHQAMAMQPSEEFAPNTVMAVMQKGYVLNGRLLRPAMVMVSTAATDGIDTQA